MGTHRAWETSRLVSGTVRVGEQRARRGSPWGWWGADRCAGLTPSRRGRCPRGPDVLSVPHSPRDLTSHHLLLGGCPPPPRRQGQSGLDRRLRPCLWVLWIRPLPAPLKLRRKNVNWLWTSGSLQSCRDTIAGWHLGPGWAAAPGPSAHDWGLGVGDQLRCRGARRPVSKAEQGRAGARASVCQLGLAWGVGWVTSRSARPSLQPAG